MYSAVYDPINQRPSRAIIEYSLDWNTAGTTGPSRRYGPAPRAGPVPNNGLFVGRLRRRVLQQAGADASSQLDTAGGAAGGTPGALPPIAPILVDRVMSFEVEWVDAKASDLAGISGRAPDIYLSPNNTTKDGSAFVLTGSLIVNSDADAHVNHTSPTTTDETSYRRTAPRAART